VFDFDVATATIKAATLKYRLALYGILLFVIVGAVLGYGQWCAHNAREAEAQKWQTAIDKLNTEAATKLAGETRKVLALERALADITAKQEADYEKRRFDTHAAAMQLDRAAADHGGVFVDPNGRSCGGSAQAEGPRSAASGEIHPAEAGGVLSVQLSNLLREKLREADDINDAYALCRGTAIGVTDKINEGTEERTQSP
jgi:hypothetical protein